MHSVEVDQPGTPFSSIPDAWWWAAVSINLQYILKTTYISGPVCNQILQMTRKCVTFISEHKKYVDAILNFYIIYLYKRAELPHSSGQ